MPLAERRSVKTCAQAQQVQGAIRLVVQAGTSSKVGMVLNGSSIPISASLDAMAAAKHMRRWIDNCSLLFVCRHAIGNLLGPSRRVLFAAFYCS